MTRDEIVEVMARACFLDGLNPPGGCGASPWEVQPPAIQAAHRRKASAALTALEAKGLVVVPREPTDGMLHDGSSAYDYPSVYMGGPSEGGKRLSARIYRAMLAAALPESPTERGKDDE